MRVIVICDVAGVNNIGPFIAFILMRFNMGSWVSLEIVHNDFPGYKAVRADNS